MKLLVNLATITMAILAVPAVAQERNATFTVELKINGQENWQNASGTDTATIRYQQKISFSTVLRTDGQIVEYNSKDPSYAAQQLAKAQQTTLAVTKARGLKPMTQAEFQERVQKAQAACGTDTRCLMNLSTKVAEWSMQLQAGMPVDASAAAQDEDGAYLYYIGFENCGARIHIDMQNKTEGHYADVQGAVPFSVTAVANYDASKLEQEALCAQTSFVVDTKRNLLHGDGWLVGPPKGTVTRTEGGRTERASGEIPFRGEIIAWASEQLRNAPLKGTRKAVLDMSSPLGTDIVFAASKGGGKAEVELSWRFE